jgi:hypothetical protein
VVVDAVATVEQAEWGFVVVGHTGRLPCHVGCLIGLGARLVGEGVVAAEVVLGEGPSLGLGLVVAFGLTRAADVEDQGDSLEELAALVSTGLEGTQLPDHREKWVEYH